MELFDITSKDIRNLEAGELRDLIGLLCESEFRKAGLPVNGVAWGGDQNAGDGGRDVSINCKRKPKSAEFIPKRNTIFQVKKHNIAPAGIQNEMKPGNKLRPCIKGLIAAKGAYVIVTAATVAEEGIEDRKAKMQKAVFRHRGGKDLYVDFIDGAKIATWVRKHPAIVVWVRNKCGRSLQGWQPFANWSGEPDTVAETYIPDEGTRIRFVGNTNEEGLNSVDGLNVARKLLLHEKSSLRLTGLSGVGKTRFVQALFEDIGDKPLNQNLAIYTDMANNPTPDPGTLSELLDQDLANVILIIDNCPPELHKQLIRRRNSEKSKIRLLTIEYDVREDLPEETEVLIMEPSSELVIQRLIERRFPRVGWTNARSIAELSGGNARIAIALAARVKRGETVSTLRDEELFVRLFRQRNPEDKSLLESAEICSLVYSFEGTKTDSNSELTILSELGNIEPAVLYKHVTDLKRRQLVQVRDVWRALLPQALANKLAKRALESITKKRISDTFEIRADERLFKSFTNRIRYLHDSEAAINIARQWLEPSGRIGKTTGDLSDFDIQVLTNIAPIVQRETVLFFERLANGINGESFVSRSNPNFHKIVDLLHQLAYESFCFAESTQLICRFALTEKADERYQPIRPKLAKLFQLKLSATHATAQQRRDIIFELLSKPNDNENALGLMLLSKALQASSFTGAPERSFGARTRDYGYWPETADDYINWYKLFIGLTIGLATQEGRPTLTSKIRSVFAKSFRSLWRMEILHELLEISATRLRQFGFWREGWVSVRTIFRFDTEGFSEIVWERLRRVELFLRPSSLAEKARAAALATGGELFDFGDIRDESRDAALGYQRQIEATKMIAAEAVADTSIFESLLPEFLVTESQTLEAFGIGIGQSTENLAVTWQMLNASLAAIAPQRRKFQLIIGFLHSCYQRDIILLDRILDSMLTDEMFRPVFPYIQAAIRIDIRGVERLKKSLDLNLAAPYLYQNLEMANFDASVTDEHFVSLLAALGEKRNCSQIVFNCLYAKFCRMDIVKEAPAKEIRNFGSLVLSSYLFDETPWESTDHCLAVLVKKCIGGNHDAASKMCVNLLAAIPNLTFYYHEYQELTISLASVEPWAFLNVFAGVNGSDEDAYSLNDSNENPFNIVAEGVMELWCKSNPDRIPFILSTLVPFDKSSGTRTLRWKPIIFKLVTMAPEVEASLRPLHIWLSSWSSGAPLVQIFEERVQLLDDFSVMGDSHIKTWAQKVKLELQERMKSDDLNRRKRLKIVSQAFE